MNVERKHLVACVLQGKIYVIGGQFAASQLLKTTEMLQPRTWSINDCRRDDA